MFIFISYINNYILQTRALKACSIVLKIFVFKTKNWSFKFLNYPDITAFKNLFADDLLVRTVYIHYGYWILMLKLRGTEKSVHYLRLMLNHL